MKRRVVVLSGVGAAGALVLGWAGLPPRGRLGTADLLPVEGGEVALNGWIKVAPDGSVSFATPFVEMGQGVHTALALLVAEEMDVAPSRVRPVQAPHDTIYGNVAMFVGSLPLHPTSLEPGHETTGARLGQWMVRKIARELGIAVTGGSSTVADAWEPLRLAAATARAQLLGAASLRWKLPVDELQVDDGVVTHVAGHDRGHYGELAAAAAATRPSQVRFKPRAQWKWIGKPNQPRSDAAAKSNGSARFGLDTRLPGMVYAVVRHAPALGGAPGRIDAAAAMKLPGVERVVRLGPMAGSTDAVAVVGRSTWHARQGANALEIDWRRRPGPRLESAAILNDLEASARAAAAEDEGFGFYRRGDGAAGLAKATQRIEAVYRAPYLAHATMEPMNCTARVNVGGQADGTVEVWAPTQVPDQAREVAARVAGVEPEQVTVHVTLLGGGFGRRLEADYVAQAVRVALETGGRPVQLVWTREEDFTHDFYRPAGAALLRGGLDERGRLTALTIHSAGDAITPRWMERTLPRLTGPIDMPDKTTAEGLFDLAYDVPHQRMAHVATRSGVPIGFWRSVGHSHNAFFSEGFVDELAHAARADPVAFRLGLLGAMPRHAAVLKLAADRAGWGQALPAGQARGVALHESFGSIVAMVLEVSLDTAGGKKRPRVHRVVCAVDCGTAVNPDGIAQQVESSVVFGLSAALDGRVDIVDGQVQQKNFPDYPLVGMRDAPVVETHLVASAQAPSGMGEPALPPLAPALANALFALTGQRLRSLPLVLA
ncbi:xanthine dehydrogenase family protein molybdopterin-binding subunit [Ideonella sp.]|uniref:xanthine dehydrogenase family protein molybdopterin-binding subunit n=1 Tax=Ideonella sp. TaxID=1929293 RepID=UPI002B48ADCC|nr:molybdopterin cofactor-binding domain-containing protein [Ideonella sp.]HJV72004.1 molybdopterin cofactor-binding domain-containing protein [Ideonella sp.]